MTELQRLEFRLETVLQANIDTFWLLVCAILVFLMQPGFMCLESGLSRNKNSINVALKNVTDFGIAVVTFWAFGFGIEVVADEQKRRFRACPENQDCFITTGLWSRSQHPNYLGSQLLRVLPNLTNNLL